MMEFFSDLFILIPLALIIALRILQARGQQQKKVQPKKHSTGKSPVGYALPRRRERKILEQRAPASLFAPETYPSPPVEAEPVVKREVMPISRKEKRVEEVGFLVDTAQEEMPKEGHPKTPKGIPASVAKLSPWKQAVVLSEILGQPRGW